MAIHEFSVRSNYRKAITLLNKVIESEIELVERRKENMNPSFLINRGDCYKAIRKYNQALSDYHQALELSTDKKDVQLRLALVSGILIAFV